MPNVSKGLEALLGRKPADEAQQIVQIPIKDLSPNPYQPRASFPETALHELAESIKSSGVLQPIVATRRDDKLVVVAGERRLRAAELAGLDRVPVIIRDTSPKDLVILALIENLHREDLTVVEEAKAYKRLWEEFDISQDAIAGLIKKSRSHVTNTVRLLALPQAVQDLLSSGLITPVHARMLLPLDDPKLQVALAERVVREKFTVRDLEALITQIVVPKTRRKPTIKSTDTYKAIAANMSQRMGRRVWIRAYGPEGKERGRVSIEFSSPDDFNRVQELLLRALTPPGKR